MTQPAAAISREEIFGIWVSGERQWRFLPAGDYSYNDPTVGQLEGNWRPQADQVHLECWAKETLDHFILDYAIPVKSVVRVAKCFAGECPADRLRIADEWWTRKGRKLDFGRDGPPLAYVEPVCAPPIDEGTPCKHESLRCYGLAWSWLTCDDEHAFLLCLNGAWVIRKQRIPCVK